MGTVVTFSHTMIMIILSIMMVYDIVKRRHMLLVVWIIAYGIKMLIIAVTTIYEFSVYTFEIYKFVDFILKTSEAILLMYCIFILYRQMRLENSKHQPDQQAESDDQNSVELNECNST